MKKNLPTILFLIFQPNFSGADHINYTEQIRLIVKTILKLDDMHLKVKINLFPLKLFDK